jgi:predicted DNA-binding transcriptional regulator AlpA
LKLLTIIQTCERMGLSRYTLANYRRDGFGPPYLRLKGNDIRYPEDSLEKWIEQRMVTSLAQERGEGRKFPGSEKGGFQ